MDFNKMKRILLSFLAIFFPWLVLLIKDDPAGAFIALVMQVTIIGWIPACMWAFRSLRPPIEEKKTESTSTKGTDIDASR
jgi:uncharacterized membrane protein YqaE (UPF0057 family)